MIKTETVLITLRYDDEEVDNPKEWNWADVLDVDPDDILEVR